MLQKQAIILQVGKLKLEEISKYVLEEWAPGKQWIWGGYDVSL